MNSALIQPMMSDVHDPKLNLCTNDTKDSFEFLTKQLAALGGSDQKSEDLKPTQQDSRDEVLSPAPSHEDSEVDPDSNLIELERLRSELDRVTSDFH